LTLRWDICHGQANLLWVGVGVPLLLCLPISRLQKLVLEIAAAGVSPRDLKPVTSHSEIRKSILDTVSTIALLIPFSFDAGAGAV
jgi:hypothetical protein